MEQVVGGRQGLEHGKFEGEHDRQEPEPEPCNDYIRSLVTLEVVRGQPTHPDLHGLGGEMVLNLSSFLKTKFKFYIYITKTL